jgi:4'-phosphopantetheinyl transferase EntD
MIERLLPSTVIAVEAFGDVPGEPVFPGEWEYVERAVDGRRREFVTARRCAREALARLGYPPAPIPRGPRREPQWPAGVVGSITHCAGYRAAVVARAEDMASAGIDAEPHEPLPAGVGAIVTSEEERAMLARLPGEPSVHWDRLLFSAKESIFKAWYPLTRRELDFDEAQLHIDPRTRTFTGHLRADGARLDGGPPLTTLGGTYLIECGIILTAVVTAA